MSTNRRSFLSSMAAAIAVSGIRSAQASPAAKSAPVKKTRPGARPKNVVLMICDDLGYGDLGCYGSKIPTPNLDAMAAAGTRFLHCNAAHPICSASRGALLTGRYAARSNTIGAYFPHAKSGMALDETTLANLFQNKGHRTKAIGKWHLGDAPEYLPTKRGFESFFGVPYSDDMEPLPMIRDTTIIEPETDRDLLTPRYTEEAVKFISEASDHPFFLYLAYSYPHDPARASKRFQGRSGLGDYGDSVQEIDWSVGEVKRALESKGLLSDTLMLFTSDHGPWWQGSPANLRGRKCSTFEGGFRVPLIAHWPNGSPAGKVSDAWISNLDILPTLTSLCGLNASPKPLDGVNISQTLLGEQQDLSRRTILYFTPFSGGGVDIHCARRGDWKLRFAQLNGEIYVNDYTAGRQSFFLPRAELYNLSVDPTESFDVAKQHPEIVKEIMAEVATQMATMPANVIDAFTKLQTNMANVSTPPGAAPRPLQMPHFDWAWEPPYRR